MSVRHFLSLTDCSPTELQLIIQRAIELKRQRQTGQAQETLKGRVLGMIFESRPNVGVDAFALCFKTNNAVILRGGKDAIHSNQALVQVIKTTLTAAGITEHAVGLVTDTSHEVAREMMQATE